MNESCYQLGRTLSQRKRYKEALEMLNRVEPKPKEVNELITFVNKQLAESHYLAGVKYFVDEQLEKAIKEWETALVFDPQHPKARGDIENAVDLLQKLKKIK